MKNRNRLLSVIAVLLLVAGPILLTPVAPLVQETLWYLFIAGAIFLILIALLLICMLPLILTRGKEWFYSTAGGVLQFAGILYVLGAIGNALWVLLFNGRAYISKDPTTYFIPVVPFGWWTIDVQCGGHLINNYKMWQLQVVWFFMAVAVWLATAYCVRMTKKKWSNQAL